MRTLRQPVLPFSAPRSEAVGLGGSWLLDGSGSLGSAPTRRSTTGRFAPSGIPSRSGSGHECASVLSAGNAQRAGNAGHADQAVRIPKASSPNAGPVNLLRQAGASAGQRACTRETARNLAPSFAAKRFRYAVEQASVSMMFAIILILTLFS